MLRLIPPSNKKQPIRLENQNSDSEPEVSVTRTSTPVKTNTATVHKTTPVNSRNKHLDLFKFADK